MGHPTLSSPPRQADTHEVQDALAPRLLLDGGMSNARLRARLALQASGLGAVTQLERIEATSNEAWRAGPFVVRVCTTPGSDRLLNEARVAAQLPASIPYPGIVARGMSGTSTWLVTERVAGITLGRVWPDLDPDQRRRAVSQLAEVLRAFHQLPASLSTMDQSPECPHPLPAPRLATLVERLRQLPGLAAADPTLLDQVTEHLAAHGDALDAGPPATLVHGDLHFENLLWHAGRVSAVLDLEWSRPGPPDLDLDILLRFCADPGNQVSPDYARRIGAGQFRQVPTWLREDYPELFAHPRLHERLDLYGLAYDLRQLLRHPPRDGTVAFAPHHPLRRVRRRLDGEDGLAVLSW